MVHDLLSTISMAINLDTTNVLRNVPILSVNFQSCFPVPQIPVRFGPSFFPVLHLQRSQSGTQQTSLYVFFVPQKCQRSSSCMLPLAVASKIDLPVVGAARRIAWPRHGSAVNTTSPSSEHVTHYVQLQHQLDDTRFRCSPYSLRPSRNVAVQ